ncbi:MAG: serine/threonine-protein phosphatase [Lachnospiraceae bacterium]|nr:serine/threonine-protein phosphatase [Lachnospiraceae bacterium]
MNLSIGCVTDIGYYRNKNQDRVMCKRELLGEHVLAVACVCDGIGSFADSEIASGMMIDGVSAWFDGVIKYFPNVISKSELIEDLDLTLQELNELLYEYRTEQGMEVGCTMSLMLMINYEYYIFHVGDSRVYCLRDKLIQLTQDEVILKQINGRAKTMLVNYVGKNRLLSVNKQYGRASRADMYILGSDGLYELMTYEDVYDMKRYISKDEDAEKVCRILVSLVLSRGEKDNVSCAILQLM